ncbi:unnamed protein product [Pedinophyceae sp. YPF-701]|nr:unnamed protein product [Pedinophyceae sp. YPF-701]
MGIEVDVEEGGIVELAAAALMLAVPAFLAYYVLKCMVRNLTGFFSTIYLIYRSMVFFMVVTVGILYPLFRTAEALMTEATHDDHVMLHYWFMFAGITLLESILENFFGIRKYSLFGYNELKVLLLTWMVAPWYEGASDVYTQDIKSTAQVWVEAIRPHIVWLELLMGLSPAGIFSLLREGHLFTGSAVSEDDEKQRAINVDRIFEKTLRRLFHTLARLEKTGRFWESYSAKFGEGAAGSRRARGPQEDDSWMRDEDSF